MEQSNKHRLLKNTIVLYVRTLITMIISLFTSRVILQNLGVEDYGVYNVVGGFVSMFAIVSSTLTGTTQRYLTYEIGKKEGANPQKIFGLSINIHIGLSVIILVLLETIGLWFLNEKLNISNDRIVAANWVYQFSILSFIINILSTPYNAVIIAHEKMKAFAYISLIDVVLKLIIVYLIVLSPYDKLVVYAFLLLLISVLDRLIYGIYCGRHFPESKYLFFNDKKLYKEIFGFASMNFIGAFADILCNQGVNVILNMFFGVTVNAARGIAISVQGAITRFVGDFTTALKPQIMKEYASGNLQRSLDLCYMGSKFSYFLMLLGGLPIIMRVPYILNLWLGVEPEYTSDFVVLTLIMSAVMVLSNNITTIILANGNLKSFTFGIGGVRISMLPFIILLLHLGGTPQQAYGIIVIFEFFALIVRLCVTQKMVGASVVKEYFIKVITRIFIVTIISIIPAVYFNMILYNNLLGFICETLACILLSIFAIYIVGLNNNEKIVVREKILTKLRKK